MREKRITWFQKFCSLSCLIFFSIVPVCAIQSSRWLEFYLTFWNKIVNTLHESLSESLSKGRLSTSQTRAIIRLIYKKGDRQFLKKWRPISLLNTDCKILTTALSKKIQGFSPKIISNDQTAYIKGRFIGKNVRLINDIIQYSLENDSAGSVIFLDFEKAFDSLEWNFIFEALKRFNFGAVFITYIQCIYSKCSSSIVNMGWVSKYSLAFSSFICNCS